MKISYGAKITISVCFLLLICTTLFASTLRISWNNNTEPDLDGYRVYYGTVSGTYGHVLDVGGSVCVDIDGVEEDTVYFFAVTAYDLDRNESDFSREVSVLIHENLLGHLRVFVDGFLRLIGLGGDTATDVPRHSLQDFEVRGGFVPVNTEGIVQIENSSVVPSEEFFEGDYIIKDAIIEAGESLDLAEIYPARTYTFVSLTDRRSEIIGGIVYASQPGAYMFMVRDMAEGFVTILRVSVVDTFCYTADYLPGGEIFFLDIDSVGISIFLPESALNVSVPIGIDCNGASSNAMSALSVNKTNRVVFDIVPYGLVLPESAQISVPYEGLGPVVVEIFDEATKQWTQIDDVDVHDGVVTFSTMMLGSFNVYTPVPGTESDGFSYGSSGGGCFIDSVYNLRDATHPNSVYVFLSMIVLGAALRTVFSRKRP